MKRIVLFFLFVSFLFSVKAEDGYDLWLRYAKVHNAELQDEYRSVCNSVFVTGDSETSKIIQKELEHGLAGMLDMNVKFSDKWNNKGLVVATPKTSSLVEAYDLLDEVEKLGNEGYVIKTIREGDKAFTIIASNDETGALYGTFHFLRLMQERSGISDIDLAETPRTEHRVLNHW
ncbi:MAG TPA: alpha-glucuronidase family glycosyl hydrolase, partial [Prolixibacteraceae bacterium]|nr:alpha-glucuronidase family glycosyl hydrolase [Prolixibacteraceae bacterium]